MEFRIPARNRDRASLVPRRPGYEARIEYEFNVVRKAGSIMLSCAHTLARDLGMRLRYNKTNSGVDALSL